MKGVNMIVYRVEGFSHKLNRYVGPYNENKIDIPNIYDLNFQHWSYHKGPYSDGIDIDKITKNHIFGFQSITLFYRWFEDNEILEKMSKYYQLSIYHISDVDIMFGHRQVVFIQEKSRLVDRIPILTDQEKCRNLIREILEIHENGD